MPTVRKRDLVWEIFAGRGVPSAAVNWWTTDDVHAGALDSIGQMSIFVAAAAGVLAALVVLMGSTGLALGIVNAGIPAK